eukprot:2421912-Rhodomonas_salina.1
MSTSKQRLERLERVVGESPDCFGRRCASKLLDLNRGQTRVPDIPVCRYLHRTALERSKRKTRALDPKVVDDVLGCDGRFQSELLRDKHFLPAVLLISGREADRSAASKADTVEQRREGGDEVEGLGASRQGKSGRKDQKRGRAGSGRR